MPRRGAREATERGAGEILATSWDRDGTGEGYDVELLDLLAGSTAVPIIASGGARSSAHMVEALSAGASAVLAASIFHGGDTTVRVIKERLRALGVSVRLPQETSSK